MVVMMIKHWWSSSWTHDRSM